jgi:hypothetical protein
MNRTLVKRAALSLPKGSFLRDYCEDYLDLREMKDNIISNIRGDCKGALDFAKIDEAINSMPGNIEKMLRNESVGVVSQYDILEFLIFAEEYFHSFFNH